MKIRFTKYTEDITYYFSSDYQLASQSYEPTSDVQPTPALRIKGLNTFQADYIRNEEIRTAIRIKE